MKEIIQKRRLELLRLRWRLENGRTYCEPDLLPAAIDWINSELAGMPS